MSEAPAETKTESAAKGGALLGIAKLVFLVAAYVTSTSLAWVLGPETFGRYVVVAALIAVPNMVIIQALLFAVSRPMAGEFNAGVPSYALLRARGFKIALGTGGLVSGAMVLGADGIAGALNDATLATPIRVVSPICLLYGLYAVNVGTLNALRRFTLQASLDMFMAVTKTSLIVGMALLGLGLAAILAGFTVASAAVFLLSIVLVAANRPAPVEASPGHVPPPMMRFAGALIVFAAILNLLQATDLLVLKRVLSAGELDVVGYYSGALLVARVPYSLMNALALIMFPLIATLHASQDTERARLHVTQAVKISVFMLTFMSAVGAGCADEILRLIFPPAYQAATPSLQLLVWGFSGYSFTVTMAWIMNSAERSGAALALVGVTLAAAALGVVTLAPWAGASGAAGAVAGAGAVGACASLIMVYRVFQTGPRLAFVLKVFGAAAVVIAGGRLWHPGGRVGILVELTILSLVFLVLVFATRAVTLTELKALRRAQ